jgi:Asp-tRNA(Asn)/Glu-tRNA(Gln) amidotransferase A subunit family amidase
LPPELFAGPEAALVTRLRELGAVILGKSVTTEFAYFEPGPTRNPRNPAHTPGGSSSGSAAAVAAGYCELALGTQTVGSVIRPAAFCGVSGFKPTYGLLPLDGVVPYAPTLDHAGFFVRTPAELAGVLAALTGEPPAAAPEGDLAVPTGPYLEQAEPEALAAFEEQVARLAAAGRRVRRLPFPADIAEINHRHNRLAAAEMAETHREWFSRYEALYRPRTAAQIREGLSVPGDEILAGRTSCVTLQGELDAVMEREGLAAWICPAACGPAPKGLHSTGDPAMNLPWTHAGLPVATVPTGDIGGLPLGLQIVGRGHADAGLAALAAHLAAALAAP